MRRGRQADPDLLRARAIRAGRARAAAADFFYDRYSYSAPEHLWLNHEWLAEVLMAALYNAFGTVGVNLMKFACTAATIVAWRNRDFACDAAISGDMKSACRDYRA
jgi:hypothetical protein